MAALIATASREMIDRLNAIRVSWSIAERRHRARVAYAKQRELMVLLKLLPDERAAS